MAIDEKRSFGPWLICLCLAVQAGLAGCNRTQAPADGAGVLVIVVDGLRADHLGSFGYDRDTTDSIDRLASEGVSFKTCYTTSPQIIPSYVSLLAGCDPNIARRPRHPQSGQATLLSSWYIPEEVPRLARSYLKAGYATAAYVDHPWISPIYGFDAGFQSFRTFVAADVETEHDLGLEGVGRPFLRWLGRLDADQRWFGLLSINDLERVWDRTDPLWDTYYEPREELSYLPPVGEAHRIFFAVPRHRWSGGSHSLGDYEAKYDGALRLIDAKLSRLFDRLRDLDRWDRTMVVVVGSLGLSFGESGMILDTGTFSDVDLHVPLIIKPAANVPFEPGAELEGLISTMDLAPTLLEMSGLPRPSGMHGSSHVPVLTGAPSPRSASVVSCGVQGGFAVIDENFCFESMAPPGPGPLSASWFGDLKRHGGPDRVYLHDRRRQPFPGHIHPPATERDEDAMHRAGDLRQIGEKWLALLERARMALHPVPWAENPVTEEELFDLCAAGLVPMAKQPKPPKSERK